MSVTQPGPSGPALSRRSRPRGQNCESDIVRGAGGRPALERYSDRVDALLRQLFADAGAAGRTRRGAGARRLRPPPSLSPLRHRSADAVRRPHRPAEEQFLRASCIRCGISASSSATRCASSTSSRSSRPTTPSSCWRCSTRGRSPGARALFDRFGALFHTAAHARVHPAVAARS